MFNDKETRILEASLLLAVPLSTGVAVLSAWLILL